VTGRGGWLLALALAVSGCGAPPGPTLPPESMRPIGPDDRAVADEALRSFLSAMASPDVTYRVTGHLRIQPVDENGQAALDIRTRYDVRGDDYAGHAYLAGWNRDPTVGGSLTIVVLDGTAHLLADTADRPAVIAAPDSLRRPTLLRGLTAEDLELVGIGDDGLLEYDLDSWLGGDPIGEWSDLDVVPPGDFPPTEVRSHRTRLFLDEAGVPRRLITSWTFAVAGTTDEAMGTIIEEIESLGMYVTITEPEGPIITSSHDIAVGVDAQHQTISKPWYEVRPEGRTASLVVEFEEPDQPLMLGIEGAIGFIRSHDRDGALILDRIVSLTGRSTLDMAAGEQTVVVYYRTCSGSCSRLDGPTDFCSVVADLAPGGSFRLIVHVRDRNVATCTLEEAG
jgi:hypothetical protein